MATNKNQHFVPRCYLRPFTLAAEGRVVSLFNLDRQKAIPTAPVRGQCSGDYFYGDDLRLEKRLQPFEGAYASLLKEILSPEFALRSKAASMLAAFWLLQFLRTDAAARHEVESWARVDADMGLGELGAQLTLKQAVQTAMRVFFDAPALLGDLNVRLIRNRTKKPFITSDNPAAMMNRWYATDARNDGIGTGLGSAGMTGLLALSPDVLCLLYDPDVYSVSHRQGWLEVFNEGDVDALNEHQVLNCQANLYFSPWSEKDGVAELVVRSVGRRLAERYSVQYAVYEGEERNSRIFRASSAEEARHSRRSLIHLAHKLPTPSRWPSFMSWRPGGAVYEPNGGTGFLRRGAREPGVNYTKVKLRP